MERTCFVNFFYLSSRYFILYHEIEIENILSQKYSKVHVRVYYFRANVLCKYSEGTDNSVLQSDLPKRSAN